MGHKLVSNSPMHIHPHLELDVHGKNLVSAPSVRWPGPRTTRRSISERDQSRQTGRVRAPMRLLPALMVAVLSSGCIDRMILDGTLKSTRDASSAFDAWAVRWQARAGTGRGPR